MAQFTVLIVMLPFKIIHHMKYLRVLKMVEMKIKIFAAHSQEAEHVKEVGSTTKDETVYDEMGYIDALHMIQYQEVLK